VLKELDLSSRPRLTIYNKIDLLSHEDLAARMNGSKALAISAEKKLGLEEVIGAASRALAGSYAISHEKVSKITASDEDEMVFDERNQRESRFTK
jgi:50S ribosomal subunit-associated GTPase HflX